MLGHILAAILFLQVPLPQQPRNLEDITVRGKLIFSGPQRNDVRIEVRLERAGMQLITNAYTDGNGNFEFRRVSPGNYYVVIEEGDYEEVRQELQIGAGARVQTVTIMLNENISRARAQPARQTFEGEDPDVVDISQLNKKFPKKALKEYEKALAEKQKGELPKAMKRLEEVMKIAPDFYQALNNLGVIYQRSNRFDDAENAYRRAITLNPRASQPLINLGSLLVEGAERLADSDVEKTDKMLEEGREVLEQATKINPRSAAAYYYLGAAYYRLAAYEEAETSLKRSLFLDSTFGIVRLMLVNVYIKEQRWTEVLDHLNGYLLEHPNAANRPAVEEMRAKVMKALEPSKR